MNFFIEHYIQLSVGLVLGLSIFLLAYTAHPRHVMVVLLLAIPFQPVATRYGSLNMVLTYMVFIVFMMRGRLREWPFFWIVMGVALAYFMSVSQVPSFLYIDHLFYVLSSGANFALFYVVYNFFRQEGDVDFAKNVFLGIAFLVLIHFTFSSFIGFQKFALMGVEELGMTANLEGQRRLLGPFVGAEFGSDFLALQILLIGYFLLYQNSRLMKSFLVLMAMACFGFMFATGSRGGPIGLLLAGALFLVMFRKNLGAKGFFKVGIVLGLFFMAGVVVVTFSEYNVMLERLMGSHLVGLELDSRAGIFEIISEKIVEKPMLGHGPRLFLPFYAFNPQFGPPPLGFNPHSLYFFLLLTIGIVGFTMYMVFFIALVRHWWRWRRHEHDNPMISGIPRMGLVIMFFFLLTEYRIEFLRFTLNDYQNYMFALWGTLMAFTGLHKKEAISAGEQLNRPVDTLYKPVRVLYKRYRNAGADQ